VKVLLGILTAIGSMVTGAIVWEGGPDPAIYPEQTVPIYFTHNYHTRKPDPATHIDGEGLACTFCHQNVSTSTSASTRDIPGHGGCDTCHGEWIGDEKEPAPPKACEHCHKSPDDVEAAQERAMAAPTGATKAAEGPEVPHLLGAYKVSMPKRNIKFAHKTHVKSGIGCIECHANVPKKTVATRDDFPTMDRCIVCHEKRNVSTECTTCHFTLPSGRLATSFESGELRPKRLHSFAIHDADFLRGHAVPAQRDKAYCANCHADSYCLTCHDGVARDVRYHPGDWISMHGIRSRIDDYRCQACHRLQSFCLDCHVRSGVATVGTPQDAYGLIVGRRTIRGLRDASGNFTPTGPHPMAEDGWVNPKSKNFHGFFAQRNIKSCASCHQEQFCITCHRSNFVDGTNSPLTPRMIYAGNPHGPNPERLRGSTARMHNARMCLKCHSPLDPNWR
jgi:hypothetical protein